MNIKYAQNVAKNLSRKEKLEKHKEKCQTEPVVMPKQSVKEFPCNYSEKIFTKKDHVQHHESVRHLVKTPTGYMVVENKIKEKTPQRIYL